MKLTKRKPGGEEVEEGEGAEEVEEGEEGA